MRGITTTVFVGLLMGAVVPVLPLGAQEDSPTAPAEFFLEGDLLLDEDPKLVLHGQDQGFLKNETPRIGGAFEGRFDTLWNWQDEALVATFAPAVGGTFFLDARPREDFRVFAKVEADLLGGASGKASEDTGVPPARVLELFSDFDLGRTVFVRVGKQTIQSGVGLYFSPADLLSLASIDPEDPSAEREGPIAVRVHLPLGTTNLYLYEVMNNAQTPDSLTVFRAEVVVGGFELGVGGFYQKDLAPRLMATSTGALGPLGSFAELVVSRGSDRSILRSDGFTATKNTTDVFVDATVGFSYSHPVSHWSLSGQYYYNGDGYEDSKLLPKARALAASPGSPITGADLDQWGRHFAAVGLTAWDLFGIGFGTSVLWISDLSDLSGRVVPQLSYRYGDFLTTTLGVPYVYGPRGSDYAPMGNSASVTLSVSLGSGSF